MANVSVFFCEPTGQIRGWLRRYVGASKCEHPENHGYHDANALIFAKADQAFEASEEIFALFPKYDPRWPRKCACGFVFEPHHTWQYSTRKLYRRADTGELFVLRPPRGAEAPLGAMWDANWYQEEPSPDRRVGPDGMSLHVMTPRGPWCVDARARNCDSPCFWCQVPFFLHQSATCRNPGDGKNAWTIGQYVDSQPHYCWVRHGDPRTERIHVDKNGVTCKAGSGSISKEDYHGFLHFGKLTGCP